MLVALRLSPLARALALASAVSGRDGHVGGVRDVGEAFELRLLLLVEARPVAHRVDRLLVGEGLSHAHDRGSTPARVAGRGEGGEGRVCAWRGGVASLLGARALWKLLVSSWLADLDLKGGLTWLGLRLGLGLGLGFGLGFGFVLGLG